MDVPPTVLIAIGNIKHIKLKHRGIIELLKYSADVIDLVNAQTKFMHKGVKDKFKWFDDRCNEIGIKREGAVLYEQSAAAAKRIGAWSNETYSDLKIEGQHEIPLDPKQQMYKAMEDVNLSEAGREFLKSIKPSQKKIVW